MGALFSSSLSDDEINMISLRTPFKRHQILFLHRRFLELDREKKGYLDREDLYAITDLMENPLHDRIIAMFFEPNQVLLRFHEYCEVLGVFLRPSSKTQLDDVNSVISKMHLVFSVIAGRADPDHIDKSDILKVLAEIMGSSVKNAASEQDAKEMMNQMALRILREFDTIDLNSDGVITFEEFQVQVEGTNLMQKVNIKV